MEGLVRPDPLQGQFRVPQDDAQHIVEVVGHPAGQPSHRLNLLGLGQLGLELLIVLLGQLSRGDIAERPRGTPARRLPPERQFPSDAPRNVCRPI